jgi:hypothetical protein
MTMFMKEVNPGHYVQSSEDDIAVALDEHNTLIAYSKVDEEGRYGIKRSVFEAARCVEVRRDLLDCHLYVKRNSSHSSRWSASSECMFLWRTCASTKKVVVDRFTDVCCAPPPPTHTQRRACT